MDENVVKKYSIEHFFPKLSEAPEIREEMENWREGSSKKLIAAMRGESRLDGKDRDFIESVVGEVLACEGEIVGSIPAGMSGYEFSIDIHKFGPVFWASAVEFDDVGFFVTQEDAEGYAGIEWSSFIIAHEERNDESD